MSEAKSYYEDIPEGFQIFEPYMEIAGIQFHKEEAQKFIKEEVIKLIFEQEIENKYDKNAIKIYGLNKSVYGIKRRFLGYIPSKISTVIIKGGYLNRVQPRLISTYIGDNGFVEIQYQIIGPKGEHLKYKKLFYEGSEILESKTTDIDAIVNKVKVLKLEKRYLETIDFLLPVIDRIEKESKRKKEGVSPWFYEQLAIIYRRLKLYDDEVLILERYENQLKAPGVGESKLAVRLLKARELQQQNKKL